MLRLRMATFCIQSEKFAFANHAVKLQLMPWYIAVPNTIGSWLLHARSARTFLVGKFLQHNQVNSLKF